MRKFSIRSESGFTMIEIMVAVTLSLVLLGGVTQIYMGSKTTYKLQDASANVQENGRFGMEFVAKDIRMAGYMGCANSKTVSVTNNVDITKSSTAVDNTVAGFDGTNGITGYSYRGGVFPAILNNYGLTAADVVAETDLIFLQGARGCTGGDIVCHNNSNNPGKTCPGITGNVNSAEYKIADNTECQIAQNDILLLSNCVTADIHGVTNNPSGSIHVTIAHGANLNNSPKLSASYGEGSSIYKMTAAIYYLGFGASGEPALFRNRLSGSNLVTEELVDGIYGMDITYGEDTDANRSPNRYVDAANVANWENVVSVRITLHSRSRQDQVTERVTGYSYDGSDISDRRLRRDFTSTFTIRNRAR